MHDAVTGRWHQTWVDDSGLLLLLDGGLQEDGSMLMEGTRPRQGGVARHRVRWSPLEGGRVRQKWDQSDDDGVHWKNLVDLVYSPEPEAGEDE